MAIPFPFGDGGSATGVLITDGGHVPGGDGGTVASKLRKHNAFVLFPLRNHSKTAHLFQMGNDFTILSLIAFWQGKRHVITIGKIARTSD